jgi:uncharacterized cupin superfamily protein
MKANILSVALDARLDEAGFRHTATALGERLGARRIGAAVYEAAPGLPIWPYHYHHGIEEWLYVVAGAPVLREPAGERTLGPGDLVRFPPGHLGAHTLSGPGRFVIFDAEHHGPGAYFSVYPDSDKVSGPSGILLRSSAVGYWHGEGTSPPEPPEVVREPASAPPLPVANVADTATLVGERLEATVFALAPGEAAEPYHYVVGREQWLLVLAGTAGVRRPHGEERLDPGDVVCLPEGPAGAHELGNRGEAAVRGLRLSTTGLPANVCYPDTGRWRLCNGPGDEVGLRAE